MSPRLKKAKPVVESVEEIVSDVPPLRLQTVAPVVAALETGTTYSIVDATIRDVVASSSASDVVEYAGTVYAQLKIRFPDAVVEAYARGEQFVVDVRLDGRHVTVVL